ncbi:MAG TPA: hypothetical protein PLO69_11050 [Gammaproteobacteria bacterium]|nr:hypothetical protein [Gammaproteobacteria bacterium]
MTTDIADTLPADLPVLLDGPDMDLPAGATLNPDGSVTLTLAYPKTLHYRLPGGAEKHEPIDALTFHRTTGAGWRKIKAAKNAGAAGVAVLTGMTPAKSSLVVDVLDAADGAQIGAIVLALLGGDHAGLPAQAEDLGTAVRLTLTQPLTDEDGTEWASLTFPRMSVKEQRAANASPDLSDHMLAKATGLTAAQAHALFDRLDGADARAIDLVTGFLFGSGR